MKSESSLASYPCKLSLSWSNHKNVHCMHTWLWDCTTHGATFAIWPAGQTTCWYHDRWFSKKPRTQDSQRKLLYFRASGSYTVPFLIVSRTWCIFLLRKSRVANHRGKQITPYLLKETFSAKSTQYTSLKAYKKLYASSLWTRYAAASVVMDTHIYIKQPP